MQAQVEVSPAVVGVPWLQGGMLSPQGSSPQVQRALLVWTIAWTGFILQQIAHWVPLLLRYWPPFGFCAEGFSSPSPTRKAYFWLPAQLCAKLWHAVASFSVYSVVSISLDLGRVVLFLPVQPETCLFRALSFHVPLHLWSSIQRSVFGAISKLPSWILLRAVFKKSRSLEILVHSK
jgi:hypothetical protein